jgi:hypothetical protein
MHVPVHDGWYLFSSSGSGARHSQGLGAGGDGAVLLRDAHTGRWALAFVFRWKLRVALLAGE